MVKRRTGMVPARKLLPADQLARVPLRVVVSIDVRRESALLSLASALVLERQRTADATALMPLARPERPTRPLAKNFAETLNLLLLPDVARLRHFRFAASAGERHILTARRAFTEVAGREALMTTPGEMLAATLAARWNRILARASSRDRE